MLKPVTDIAKRFNDNCLAFGDGLKEIEAGGTGTAKQEKVSKAVQVFFESIQELPASIATLDSRATVLFEIDRSLSGYFGAKVFTAIESTNPVRKLLRDLAALWQRYYLIATLSRAEGSESGIRWTEGFYDEWLATENVGTEQSEYDRILTDLSMMLQDRTNLNLSTKLVLFTLMGKILITLGVQEDFAQSKLQSYIDEIRLRRSDTVSIGFSEILLCLEIFHLNGKLADSTGIDPATLRKAIRYWASQDDFLEALFKSWGWYWQNDYTSPLAMGDQIFLKDRSSLFLSLANSTARLNVGHSYLELAEHKKNNPTLTTLYKPIPIFMFGHSGVGKTSYLVALSYDVQMRAGKSLTLGREMQAFYESAADSWHGGSVTPTTGSQSYAFWEDLNVTSFTTLDYGGKDTQPDQWEHQLQEVFRNARGLMFFIDNEDYADPARLRRRANWFDAILQYWMQGNPTLRHIPIALVLTKCDTIFGDEVDAVKRPYLFPNDLQPALIELLLQQRFTKVTEDMRTPFGRMKDCILHDRANNSHPLLQDITLNLLDNFGQFFNRVIDLTHHYQIFLTSSLPPRDANDAVLPLGTKQPMLWMARILSTFHMNESLTMFRSEEKQVENEIKVLREDLSQMQRYKDEIASANAEINRLRQKSTIFQVTMKERIKYHEEIKQRADQDFGAIVQRYAKDAPDVTNKAAGVQIVERAIHTKEDLLNAIRGKRADYESRLKSTTQGKGFGS